MKGPGGVVWGRGIIGGDDAVYVVMRARVTVIFFEGVEREVNTGMKRGWRKKEETREEGRE